jgi:hypothetical protein
VIQYTTGCAQEEEEEAPAAPALPFLRPGPREGLATQAERSAAEAAGSQTAQRGRRVAAAQQCVSQHAMFCGSCSFVPADEISLFPLQYEAHVIGRWGSGSTGHAA